VFYIFTFLEKEWTFTHHGIRVAKRK